MIKIEPYTSEFEQVYWNVVDNKIDNDVQEDILNSCIKFLPDDFFDYENPTFEKLILAPFAKLKKAEKYIRDISFALMKNECFATNGNKSVINDLYIKIHDAFGNVVNSQKDNMTMRVRIVKEADITVCPYCNRDYINCRADNVSGAQLDHFYSRAEYPLFAVSLYNFVPACGNCNRVKSAQAKDFASPFDETIDWENDVKFSYRQKNLNDIEIDIESTNPAIINNVNVMRIKEAYQIHGIEILELQEKKLAYSKSQKEEIQKVLHKIKVSDDEIKRIIFGHQITQEDMRKKPLGKMLSDLHKELNIY